MLRTEFTEDPDVKSISLFQKLQGRAGDGRDLQVGRGTDSDIVLDSKKVPLLISRSHAVLSRRGDTLFLQDQNSTNGTFINEARLPIGERRVIREGDMVSFGGAKLLRQAHMDYDEPNPFLFKLTDVNRLFTEALPQAVRDNQPLNRAHDVVDLTTLGDSPPLRSRPAGPLGRKRPRDSAAPIILDDGDSDEEPRLLPFQRQTEPPPPPSGQPGAPSVMGASGGGASFLRAMEGQFECQICREFMVATHSLVPCGHMFCGECVAEWLKKKPTCPTCRAHMSAPPVPSLKVDNMLDELVTMHLDSDTRKERSRRQKSWASNSKQLSTAMQHAFKQGASPAAHAQAFPSGSPAEQLRYFQGMVEAALGNFTNTQRGSRRHRNTRTRSSTSNAAQLQPDMPLPAHPDNRGPYCFVMLQTQKECAACSTQLFPSQPYIKEQNSNRGYHLHCSSLAPGFAGQWRLSGGYMAGFNLLPGHELARLRAQTFGGGEPSAGARLAAGGRSAPTAGAQQTGGGRFAGRQSAGGRPSASSSGQQTASRR